MSTENEDIKAEEIKEELVSKKVAEDFKNDMFKYKDKSKELEIQLNTLKLEKDAAEQDRLEKNQEWEALYAREKQAREVLQAGIAEKEAQFVDSAKINAVIEDIGGFKKSEYNKFIEVSNITIEENGSINQLSLATEVDRIKQNYSELLKSEQKPTLPNGAPAKQTAVGPKDLSELSTTELLTLYSKTKK